MNTDPVVFVKPRENNFLKESMEKGIITNPFRKDGLGEIVRIIINTIIYAKINNLKFVYTPLTTAEHNYKNDDDFLKKIEDMLGVKEDYEVADVNGIHKGLQREYRFDDSGRINDLFIQNMSELHLVKEYDEVVSKIKNRHKYEDHFSREYFNIVLHIRRANPNDTKNYDKNHVNNLLNHQMALYKDDFYINLINTLYQKYTKEQKKPIKIHIHSQDLDKIFYDSRLSKAIKKSIEYHIYEEQNKAFVSMFLCDILVTGPSTFSYSAAVIKKTGVLHLKYLWTHPPMETWDKLIIS